MKIAILTPGFLPVPAIRGGAVESLITKIIEENEIKQKFDIDLFTIYDEDLIFQKYKKTKLFTYKRNICQKLIDSIINKCCKILKIPYVSDYKYRKIISQLNKNFDYEYIIVENNMFLYKQAYKKYKGKSKFIFHLHNDIGKSDKPTKLCKYIYNTSYKILTVSNYLKNRFKEVTNSEKSDKIEVLYNCISVDRFKESNTDKTELMSQYGLKQEDVIFMYCGRLDEGKGALELVKAFKTISKKYKNAKLLIIGKSTFDSKYEYRTRQMAKEYDDQVKFIGYVDNANLPSYYNIADVIVIPTICEEAFGIVAIEAMAVGKALIVTKSGGLTEVVNDRCAGIVEKEDIEINLIKEMEKYIINQTLIKERGDNSKKRFLAIEEFNDKNYYDSFYQHIL